MTVIQRSALLPYSAAQLYTLVNDVEAYPEFLDGCVRARVLRREPRLLEAQLELARAGLAHRFSTRNRLEPDRAIALELIEGPFERFAGRWDFQQLGDSGCKISLHLEFRMNSRLLGAAATRLFDGVTNQLVDAVTRRARQLYG